MRRPIVGRLCENGHLIPTIQQADGSWAVPSTRVRDQKKMNKPASYWGTVWAAIGLLETVSGVNQPDSGGS